MVSSNTAPDTYWYDTECVPFDFVSESRDPRAFNRDSTILPDSYFTIGDTVFICLGELSDASVLESARPHRGVPSRGLERIRARQPAVIHRARELRATLGDPLIELARILQDIPVDDGIWDRIVQEPYG